MASRRQETSLVVVGRITRTHGVRGEVYVTADSDNPERFEPNQRFTTTVDSVPTLVVRSTRSGPHGLIVEFAGITSIEDAQAVVGSDLLIPADRRRELEPGEYWPDQLIGVEVRDGERVIGTVEDVVLGPQDRLVVRMADGSVGEVPFVDDLVPEVDLDDGWVRIDPPDGLFNPR